jgi:mono/diheme cytochrome c family protein
MAGLVPAMPRLVPVPMPAFIRYSALPIVIASALAFASAPTAAQDSQSFPKEQVAAGADLYAVNCAPCHGARMQDPGAAFNLRKFPPDQRERFVNSVTRGKNQMPPWGDFFKPDQLDALWAYVMAGER